MECYRFEEGLTPLAGDLPEKWEGLLLLVTPSELAELRLPEGVTPPEAPDMPVLHRDATIPAPLPSPA